MKVVTLRETNAADIVAMLRKRADEIEAGDPVKSMVAIAVSPDGELKVYGWGETDAVDSLATLQLAVVDRSIAMLGK